jgi:HK97 gp10 family phage protein
MAGLTYTNRFPELAAALKPALQKGVQATGEQMVSNIEGLAPRQTGFMAENVYVSGPLSSTYGSGSIEPPDDSYQLPEVKPGDDMTAIVGAAANYSVYVNYGTRFMAAQPFFEPGVEATRGEFDAIMAAAFAEGMA